MTKFAIALLGATSLLALPAMAQTSAPNTSASNNAHPQMTSEQAQQKIKQDLTNDGYTNVMVMPNSFLVHATNKRNEPVVMIINPDSVFAVTELPKANQPGAQSQGQTQAQGQAPATSGSSSTGK